MTEQTFKIDAWVVDSDGYLIGELHATNSSDDFKTFAKNVVANSGGKQKAIDQNINGAKKPPRRPLSLAEQEIVDRRVRLTELRQKPWSKLTALEQREATDLAFQLGQTVPPITSEKP